MKLTGKPHREFTANSLFAVALSNGQKYLFLPGESSFLLKDAHLLSGDAHLFLRDAHLFLKDAHLFFERRPASPAGKNKMFAGLAGEELKQRSSYNRVQTFMKRLHTVMKKLYWRNNNTKRRQVNY